MISDGIKLMNLLEKVEKLVKWWSVDVNLTN